jgi:HNH endonuclease
MRYSREQLEFIREKYQAMSLRDVAPLFNAKFGAEVTAKILRSTAKNHGITCGRKGKERLQPDRSMYSKEMIEFLRKGYRKHSLADLTSVFNARFGLGLSSIQIRTALNNRGINSGRTGHFVKGHKSWNKDTKGLTHRNKTSFRLGNRPPNRKPLWSERIDSRDGYILMKVPERNPYTQTKTRYKLKHVYLWEREHGPVPEGFVVAFKDGNKLHCEPENLMLISRAELLVLNAHHYDDAPEELKPSILALAKLEAKGGFRTVYYKHRKRRKKHD